MSWLEVVLALIRGLARFIAEIVHYCAWPTALLIALWWLRKPIVAAIGRFKKIQHKDWAFEFSVGEEIQKKLSSTVPLSKIGPDTPDLWNDYLDITEMCAVWSGMLALTQYKVSPEIAKDIIRCFYDYMNKVIKYRPDTSFQLPFELKRKIDALCLDEAT